MREAAAMGTSTRRDVSIDYLRTFVIVLVVVMHSMQAYVTLAFYYPDDFLRSSVPVADPNRFRLFDPFFVYINTFMMPLMFLISGLFVGPALRKHGARGFMVSRLRRLGVPFLLFAILLGPFGYWPAYLQSDTPASTPYWIRTFTEDGWPIGPGWFLWVLLLFDAIAALAYRLVPGIFADRIRPPTAVAFAIASVVVFAPFVPFVGVEYWITQFGPFDLPAIKAPLFFLNFLMGVAIGLSEVWPRRLWPHRPVVWLAVGTLAFIVTLLAVRWDSPETWPWTPLLRGAAAAVTSSGLGLALLGWFHGLEWTRSPAAGSLADNSFGIFVFHYAIVIWLQYALTSSPLGGGIKFVIVLSASLALSWLISAGLRRVPGVRLFL